MPAMLNTATLDVGTVGNDPNSTSRVMGTGLNGSSAAPRSVTDGTPSTSAASNPTPPSDPDPASNTMYEIVSAPRVVTLSVPMCRDMYGRPPGGLNKSRPPCA